LGNLHIECGWMILLSRQVWIAIFRWISRWQARVKEQGIIFIWHETTVIATGIMVTTRNTVFDR
jgi:hypothetical protein